MSSPPADLSSVLDAIVLRCRVDISWRKNKSGTICQRDVSVSPKRIKQHLAGGAALGVCPIKEGESTTEIALLDLDSHRGEISWEDMEKHTTQLCDHFEKLGCHPIAFRSSGGSGVHIFLVWAGPQDAYSVREFMRQAIETLGFTSGTKGVAAGGIEIFPKQDFVPAGGSGSQFILPLSGKSVPLDPILGYAPGEREDALDIKWKVSPPVPKLEKSAPKPTEKRQRYNGELGELQEMLENIPNTEANYDQWIQTGMALHAETGGSDEGLSLWEEWSSRFDGYSGFDELSYKWGSFRTDKANVLTAGYIKNLAENRGWHEDYSTDFEDVSDINEPPIPKKEKRERYVPIPSDEYIKRPPVKWHIKKIWPRGESMTYGASGAGKTFAVVDAVCHIAMGMDFNGHKTNRGKVIYICAEGAGGLTSRIKAWAKHHNVNLHELGQWLAIIPDTPNFLDEKDVHYLTSQIRKYQEKTDLIVVDTLAQVTAGADENSGKDMGLALSNAKKLANTLKCSYNLVHHTGKDEQRGARGWSGLKGQLDAQFYIYRDGEKLTFWIDKMKDDRDQFGFEFFLRNEVVGDDEDNEPITSCYVEYQGDAIQEKRTERKRGQWEDVLMKCVDALELEGKDTTVESVMAEAANMTPREPGKKDRRREYLFRALQSLVKSGDISVRGNTIVNQLNTEN